MSYQMMGHPRPQIPSSQASMAGNYRNAAQGQDDAHRDAQGQGDVPRDAQGQGDALRQNYYPFSLGAWALVPERGPDEGRET